MYIVAKASEFAATKHEKQRRKYTDQPYFNHLAAVVRLLERSGITDPTITIRSRTPTLPCRR